MITGNSEVMGEFRQITTPSTSGSNSVPYSYIETSKRVIRTKNGTYVKYEEYNSDNPTKY